MAKKTLADMRIDDNVYSLRGNYSTICVNPFCGIERTTENRRKVFVVPYIQLNVDKSHNTSWLLESEDWIYYFNESDALKESLKRLKNKNIDFKKRQEQLKQDVKNHMNDVMEVQQRLIELNIID